MELHFGTRIIEHGIGRLVGVEIDPTTRIVHRIAFRGDSPSEEEEMRPFAAVTVDELSGNDIYLHLVDAGHTKPETGSVRLTNATSVVHEGRAIGRLSGVEVAAEAQTLTTVFGRQHWWTRRFRSTHRDSISRCPVRFGLAQRRRVPRKGRAEDLRDSARPRSASRSSRR